MTETQHAGNGAVAARRNARMKGALNVFQCAFVAGVGTLCYNALKDHAWDHAAVGLLLVALAALHLAYRGYATAAAAKARLVGAIFDERQKLSQIVTQTTDGVAVISRGGLILLWSPGMARITGFEPELMVGTNNFSSLRARDARGTDALIDRWPSAKEELPSHVHIVTRDGSARWLSCSYSPVTDTDTDVLIVVARDATEALEVERLKDDFVATVSHELRTPLTPLKAWANTLLTFGDRLDDEQRREGLEAMLRQSDRLERLITNLLEVAKIERGVSEETDGVVDARRAIEKIVGDARAAKPDRVINFTAGIGHFRVRGDDSPIERIASSLLSNALKYAPASEPIGVTLIEWPGEIVIEVADRGPGIPPDQAAEIFDRFKRLGNHLTRAEAGAGLGLYIAKQLADSIGGSLVVHSEPGHGSTFTLRLRAADRLAEAG
ncbi:MAG: sensor histidine kinase [Actinomycetota bacterium]|nr:PAS domain-containing sensor histidine kinase [Actinomycetota bacterium]